MKSRRLTWSRRLRYPVIPVLLAAAAASGRAGEQPGAAPADVSFALKLFRNAGAEPGNLVLSPSSVAEVLAMAEAGARGPTAAEIARVLGRPLPPDPAAPPAVRNLPRPGAGNAPGVVLQSIDSLWFQPGVALRPPFLHTLRADFGADVRPADFRQSPEAARRAINAWAGERTHGRIAELIAPGILGRQTRLVLVNTIYFNGRWTAPFDPRRTGPDPFHLTPTRGVLVPTMHRQAWLRTIALAGVRLVELPYAGDALSMVVLLPDGPPGLDGLDARLTREDLGSWLVRLEAAGPTEIELAMPRFSLASGFDLNAALKAMGIAAAFDPRAADFSGMTGDRSLWLSDVIHRATIEVTETGTVATAATGGVMVAALAVAHPLEVRIDRPFLFLLRDRATGAVLFLGRVTDPR